MTSAINPSIDVNYPVPGVNNSSQGFRSNFASINSSLQTAATEITDLQSKVLLKSALTGQTLDNDMNNGIIKNAQTLNFRASTYDLGSNLTGTVNIDLTLGDVQTGITGGNINLSFSGWATASPSGKWGGVDVILTGVSGRTIILPTEVRLGVDTIEGYDSSTNSITIPSTVSRVHYRFNSISCGVIVSGNAGSGIEIVPMDRPRQATQLDLPAPSSSTATGIRGQIAYDSNYVYVCVATNSWKRSALSTW